MGAAGHGTPVPSAPGTSAPGTSATGGSGGSGGSSGVPVAGYEVTGSRRPFAGHVVAVRVDDIVGADGRRGTREVVEHPGAVAALVVDTAGRLVLVEQWRQPMGRIMLEIVAGRYDVDGETVEEALRRELAEELGMGGGQLTWLTTCATTPGWSDELLDVYLVEGAASLPGGRPERGWEEATLRPVTLTLEQAAAQVASGGVGDAKTLVALGLYGLLRSGLWRPAGFDPRATVPADRAAALRPPGGGTPGHRHGPPGGT